MWNANSLLALSRLYEPSRDWYVVLKILVCYITDSVTAICYACIAPLVLLFGAIGLFLFYLAYKYNMLFVSNASIDTKVLLLLKMFPPCVHL